MLVSSLKPQDLSAYLSPSPSLSLASSSVIYTTIPYCILSTASRSRRCTSLCIIHIIRPTLLFACWIFRVGPSWLSIVLRSAFSVLNRCILSRPVHGPLVDTVPPLAYRLVTHSSASIYYPIVDTLLPIALSPSSTRRIHPIDIAGIICNLVLVVCPSYLCCLARKKTTSPVMPGWSDGEA